MTRTVRSNCTNLQFALCMTVLSANEIDYLNLHLLVALSFSLHDVFISGNTMFMQHRLHTAGLLLLSLQFLKSHSINDYHAHQNKAGTVIFMVCLRRNYVALYKSKKKKVHYYRL